MGSTDEVSLVLSAALAPPADAIVAWHRLMTDVGFEHLAHPGLRALPRVYLNLRSAPDEPPNWAQLRGTYRAAWTANLLRFGHARALITPLQERAIAYRLVKGAAICAMSDSWGARSMGDIDVLVDRADEGRVAEVMSGLRWRPKYEALGPRDPFEGRLITGAWVGSGHDEVDLHVTGSTDPGILGAILREPAQNVTTQGVEVQLPTPELMLVHAAVHGALGVAATDRIQTTLDVGLLAPQVSPERLRIVASALGVRREVLEALRSVAPWSAEARHLAHVVGRRTLAERAGESGMVVRRRLQPLTRISELRTVVEHRRLPAPEVAKVRETRGARARLYSTWLRAGQLRPVERAVARSVGGFLPRPTTVMPSPATFTWSPGSGHGVPGVSLGPIPLSDLRMRLRLPQDHAPVRLTLDYESPGGDYRQVFIDGVMHGGLPVGADAEGTYLLEARRGDLEISLRRTAHSGSGTDWGQPPCPSTPSTGDRAHDRSRSDAVDRRSRARKRRDAPAHPRFRGTVRGQPSTRMARGGRDGARRPRRLERPDPRGLAPLARGPAAPTDRPGPSGYRLCAQRGRASRRGGGPHLPGR